MTDLSNLINHDLKLVNVTNAGNIFTDGNITCLLKPTNRNFNGKSKKPVYYLSAIDNGKSTYLSGLFATNDSQVFSADYKDGIGMKHIVKIRFADAGKSMTVQAA